MPYEWIVGGWRVPFPFKFAMQKQPSPCHQLDSSVVKESTKEMKYLYLSCWRSGRDKQDWRHKKKHKRKKSEQSSSQNNCSRGKRTTRKKHWTNRRREAIVMWRIIMAKQRRKENTAMVTVIISQTHYHWHPWEKLLQCDQPFIN